MPTKKPARKPKPQRGLLARPLDSLVFLLPLIIFFQVAFLIYPEALAAQPQRVIAFGLVLRFFELFGQFGMWAPALAIVVILIATHAAAKEPWTIHLSQVSLMYAEAMLMAVPLLVLNWAVPLQSVDLPSMIGAESPSVIETLALGIGAGVYEELIFRLVLISIVMMIGVDVMNAPATPVAITAVAISALVFAAHHHAPLGVEPFDVGRFAFRTLAGVYLAVIFWFRGYGPAAGCHAAYNVALALAA